LIGSGDNPVRVATKTLGLKLQPNSTVLVEIKPFHSVSVLVISGGEGAVQLRSKTRPKEIVSLHAGETFFTEQRDDADAWRAAKTNRVNSLAQIKPDGINSQQRVAFNRFVEH